MFKGLNIFSFLPRSSTEQKKSKSGFSDCWTEGVSCKTPQEQANPFAHPQKAATSSTKYGIHPGASAVLPQQLREEGMKVSFPKLGRPGYSYEKDMQEELLQE